MDLSTIVSFTVVVALLIISPGPNGVLIAKTVPTSGKLAGFANITGFISAVYLHGALSFFGISLLLVQSAQLFFLIGAAYLGWIGIKALIDAWRGAVVQLDVEPAKRRRTLWLAFVEGFLTNALNPKMSMFYLAAFPQFLSASEATAANTFLLVFIHSLLNFLWFTLLILLFARASAFARSGEVQRWIRATTGFVFIGFGFKLATTRI